MRTSITWINDYLDPPADIREQAVALTTAGFPDEGEVPTDNGEESQEVEMTSNRGDCLCHLGLAREIAVVSDRTLKEPHFTLKAEGPSAQSQFRVKNHAPDMCPLYTARVIRGVHVGESPDWLKTRLQAIGLVPRNNIVDATNFVLFEYGQPTHVFDIDKLFGNEIHIRYAKSGETMLPIGEGATPIKLHQEDLVIADTQRPIALAGVKGGAETSVEEGTVDILLEAATFDPVVVRSTSRRHQISSDSSYRFERGVHPADVDIAAQRLASLIMELAGGELSQGDCRDGNPIPDPISISIRPERCRQLLGIDIPDERIQDLLLRLELQPKRVGDHFECEIPPRRLDLVREIDLIEEVGRTHGYDNLPIKETITIKAVPPHPTEEGMRAIRTALVGMGFVETVTHSLIAQSSADDFSVQGHGTLQVDGERAGADPVLRPSIVPSLLRVARHNHDHGAGWVQLFETAATWKFHESSHTERRLLGLICDSPEEDDSPQAAYGLARAAVERILAVAGAESIQITESNHPWLVPSGEIQADGVVMGSLGIVEHGLAARNGHDKPVAAAELELYPAGLATMLQQWPPDSHASPLSIFPAIARDLSVVLPEETTWAAVEDAVRSSAPDLLEAVEFLTVFRGKKVGEGRKSMTLRLRFRAGERTLRREEVEPQVAAARQALEKTLEGEVRD